MLKPTKNSRLCAMCHFYEERNQHWRLHELWACLICLENIEEGTSAGKTGKPQYVMFASTWVASIVPLVKKTQSFNGNEKCIKINRHRLKLLLALPASWHFRGIKNWLYIKLYKHIICHLSSRVQMGINKVFDSFQAADKRKLQHLPLVSWSSCMKILHH